MNIARMLGCKGYHSFYLCNKICLKISSTKNSLKLESIKEYLRTRDIIYQMNEQTDSNAAENKRHQSINCFSFESINQINDCRRNQKELHIDSKIPSDRITLIGVGKK